jgi:hypothetical protein
MGREICTTARTSSGEAAISIETRVRAMRLKYFILSRLTIEGDRWSLVLLLRNDGYLSVL